LTARALGEYQPADEYYGRALAVGRGGSNPRTIAQSLQCLASVAVIRGDLSRAVGYLREAVPLCVKLENKQFLGYCALHLAEISLVEGDGYRAARLLGIADGMWRSDNSTIYPTYRQAWNRACEAATAHVGKRLFSSMFASGQKLSLNDAVAFAVVECKPSSMPPAGGTEASGQSVARPASSD
jgi:hypothetical protein